MSYQAYLVINYSANEIYFRSSLEKGIITDQPEFAKLYLFRKYDSTLMNNYQYISLLSCFPKVFQKNMTKFVYSLLKIKFFTKFSLVSRIIVQLNMQ